MSRLSDMAIASTSRDVLEAGMSAALKESVIRVRVRRLKRAASTHHGILYNPLTTLIVCTSIWKSLGNRRLSNQKCEFRLKRSMGCNSCLEMFASDIFRPVRSTGLATKKPLLLDATVRKRLAFARIHSDWIVAQLDNVLRRDEINCV